MGCTVCDGRRGLRVTDLPTQLRRAYKRWGSGSRGPCLLLEAANELERLQAELDALDDEQIRLTCLRDPK